MTYSYQCVNPEATYYVTGEAECGGITPFMESVMYQNLKLVDMHLQVENQVLSMAVKAIAIIAHMNPEDLRTLWYRFMERPDLDFAYRAFQEALTGWGVKQVMLAKSGLVNNHSDLADIELISWTHLLDTTVSVAEAEVQQTLQAQRPLVFKMAIAERQVLANRGGWQTLKSQCEQLWSTLASSVKNKLVAALAELDSTGHSASKVNLNGEYTGIVNAIAVNNVRYKDIPKVAFKRQENQKATRAIKRASKLFKQFGYEQELKKFCAGEQLEVSYEDSPFVFKLQAYSEAGWLKRQSRMFLKRSPFNIELWTKSGEYLMKLCVYLDSTPVLDQLLGWLISVNTGEERVFLDKANPFSVAKDFKALQLQSLGEDHPLIKASVYQGYYHPVDTQLSLEPSRQEADMHERLQQYVNKYVNFWNQISPLIENGA